MTMSLRSVAGGVNSITHSPFWIMRPARGGMLDGPEADMLRELLAQHGKAEIAKKDSPVRGLARLLRRNPTDAERALWTAIIEETCRLEERLLDAAPARRSGR